MSMVANVRANPSLDFRRDIQPILVTHCYACHGPDEGSREADLRLDSVDIRNDKSVLVPGDPDASELLSRVCSTDEDERMPPEGNTPLSDVEVDLLRRWISAGANFESHWAYVPPQRPRVPRASDASARIQNSVDAFIVEGLEAEELKQSPPASTNRLLRRLSLLVRGLPPTPEELKQIEMRREPVDGVIERWLASPQFGDRMAQDWLDAARYADTSGHAADKPRTMWLFRDWVIDAFNRDMPFDQFTIEQLAGDMLPNPTISQRIATGFHRNSMQALGNNPRKEEYRVKGIVDRIETTGRVWLASTLACAECHDHKYDPISTKEYYQLFAVFNNIPHLGEKFEVHGPRIVVPTSSGPVEAQVMEELPERRETRIHIRGNFENPGNVVSPDVPDVFKAEQASSEPASSKQLANKQSSTKVDDRLKFAKWLVSGSHPLVARVQVNRIWQHYFAHGLVRTSDDFGVRSSAPTHPELLDWLASEFVDSGWSQKHIHRLILRSATFQQSSLATQSLMEKDPDNRLLSRFPRRRASAETIRDSVLLMSGQLHRRIGGKSVYPFKPVGVDKFKDDTAGEWVEDSAPDSLRRGLYVFWQRTSPYASMSLFDATSRERCTVKRDVTSTPLQSLVLLNDPVYVSAARALAARIKNEAKTDRERIQLLFELTVNRAPSEAERDRFLQFVSKSASSGSEDVDIWNQLATVMINVDEAISIE